MHTTDFKKALGAENKSVADKLGKDMTRALFTAPGKTLQDAVRSQERKTGKTIHNPLVQDCSCSNCIMERMQNLYPVSVVMGD